MNAGIISVGRELVSGECVDTNSAWLSAELTRRGVGVVGHATVGDDKAQIQAAVEAGLTNEKNSLTSPFGMGGAPLTSPLSKGGKRGVAGTADENASQARTQAEVGLIIITGGIGPTPDDVTREAVAEAIGQPLERDAEAYEQIRVMFEGLQRPLTQSNERQALIPRGCEVIPNRRGSAPGIKYRSGDGSRMLFVLPGVPHEMRDMFEESIGPLLTGLVGGTCTRSRRLNCFGISESRIGDDLADMMASSRNPQVGTAAAHGVITIHVSAHGADQTEAERLVESDAAEIRCRLGRAVFGQADETLPEVVAGLLTNCKQTISTAESCTGGLLAKQLTDIPGASAFFSRGYITYANEAKSALLDVPPDLIESEGAVSEAVASAMASGCRGAAGTDLALSITGIAGPGGGAPPEKPVGLVYIALAGGHGVQVKRLLFGEHLTREEIRDRSSKAALNLLRHRLLTQAD